MRSHALSILCLATSVALGQTKPEPFTVDEAVAQAVQNHPRVAALVQEIGAARSGVRSARALVNPEIVFTPAVTPGGSDEEVLLRQPLELNGTRAARTGAARAELRRIEAQALVDLRRLVFETKTAYFLLVQAREQLSLARDLLQNAEEIHRTTRRQVELGSRPGIDETQAAVEVARARQQVTQAQGREEVAQAELNTRMARLPSEPIGPLSPLVFVPTPLDLEALVRQAQNTRAEMLVERAARDVFREEANLVRAEGRPDLAPQLRAGNVLREKPEAGIGVGITLPLLDYGQRRHRIRQAEEAARAQDLRAEARRQEVRQEVYQAAMRLRAAETALKDYEQGVLAQARRLLEAGRIGFEQGQTSIVALLEAQRTFRAVQTDYTAALVEHALARTEMERATGSVSASLLPHRETGLPSSLNTRRQK